LIAVTATDPISSLPPLREAIREAGLSAKKSLGQNFLLDLNVTRRIAKSAGPLSNAGILEIGPGPGGLTRALLLEGAPKLVAIERDERFRPVLAELQNRGQGRFKALFQDAMRTDYPSLASAMGLNRIVANLPYNIATPLIVGWLTGEQWPPWFDRLVVMVQKEVAERFVAEPNSKAYGRLAVLAQYRAQPRILFTLPPEVFVPPPKVASALIEFTPRQTPGEVAIADLEKVTAAAFGQRRKMLRSSLAALSVRDTVLLLNEAGIDPSRRAETLAPQDFVRLACHFPKHLQNSVTPHRK
jgi:16S rRNA (adenine1518-N6/adenine1519-N6)-dimethyltransferase